MIRVAATTWAESEEALSQIRRQVFIEEQQVPEELEWDGEDEAAIQLLAYFNDTPIGTLRLLDSGYLGRMAVLKAYRNRGVGHALMQTMIDIAEENGLVTLELSAQTHALPFYLQFGFVANGEIFMDAGIPHRHMSMSL